MRAAVVDFASATAAFVFRCAMLKDVTVKLEISGLAKAKSAVKGDSPLARKIVKKWEARYKGFALARFNTFSKGGGDWKPLEPSTIERRRKGSGTGTPAILRDRSLLFNALNPQFQNAPGSYTDFGAWQVITGYGGSARYTGKGSTASIYDIARFHDTGDGVPERKIIVSPDAKTVAAMARDAENDINKYFSETIG